MGFSWQCLATMLQFTMFCSPCLPYQVKINEIKKKKMLIEIFSVLFKEREVLQVDGLHSPGEHRANSQLQSTEGLITFFMLLCSYSALYTNYI